ncbi:protein starmaker-like [Ptychodera flava]|uniref:protein starmaker-like n=1 Tax=Ptychodera flava TaxID=63121 RepID=UPI003969EA0E
MDRQAKSIALEKAHVHDVYEKIAPHFSDTRYKAWPRVKQFLLELEPGSLVADIGCGNGRYLPINSNVFKIGSDRCDKLVEIANEHGHEVMVCDNIRLPYRDNCFDAVISIAVIHHFATVERRAQALRELARILRPGGKLMVYVWAMEQKQRKFDSQDVLVPWHLQPRYHKHKAKRLQDLKKENTSYCSSTSDDDQQSERTVRKPKPSSKQNGFSPRDSETTGRPDSCKRCGLPQRSVSDSGLLINQYKEDTKECYDDFAKKRNNSLTVVHKETSPIETNHIFANGCSQIYQNNTADLISNDCDDPCKGDDSLNRCNETIEAIERRMYSVQQDEVVNHCSSLYSEGNAVADTSQDDTNIEGRRDQYDRTAAWITGGKDADHVICNGSTGIDVGLKDEISGSHFTTGSTHGEAVKANSGDVKQNFESSLVLKDFCEAAQSNATLDTCISQNSGNQHDRCSGASKTENGISDGDVNGNSEASQSGVDDDGPSSSSVSNHLGAVRPHENDVTQCSTDPDHSNDISANRQSSMGELIISGVRKIVNGISGERTQNDVEEYPQADSNADESWVLVEAEHKKLCEQDDAKVKNSTEILSNGLAQKAEEQSEILETKLEDTKCVHSKASDAFIFHRDEDNDESQNLKKHSIWRDEKDQRATGLKYRNSGTKSAACSDCSDNSTDNENVSLRKSKSESWLLNFGSKFSPKLLRLRAGRTTPPIAEISQAIARGQPFRPSRLSINKKSLVLSEDACSTSSLDSESDLSGNFTEEKAPSTRPSRRRKGESIEVELCACDSETDESRSVGTGIGSSDQHTGIDSCSRGNTNGADITDDPSTFKRYYHVFKEGELISLVEEYVESLYILQNYYDHANWCVVAEKVQVWKI